MHVSLDCIYLPRMNYSVSLFLAIKYQLYMYRLSEFGFTALIFVRIQAFLDRKLFTSDIADIFHKFPFGLVIASVRVSGSPESV